MRRILPLLVLLGALTARPGVAVAQPPDLDSLGAYRAAVARARAAGDSVAWADGLRALGLVHWQADRFDSALVHLVQARELQTALGNTTQLGRVLNSLGATYYQSGIYAPALDAFLRSLEIRRRIGDVRGQAVTLTNIGKTYHDWRQLERAVGVLREAVATAERSGDQAVVGYALHSLGMVHLDLDQRDEARAQFQRSTDAYARFDAGVTPRDSGSGWSINTMALAELDVRAGRPDAAVAKLNGVLAIAQRGETIRGEVEALLGLGRAYRSMGDYDRAVTALRRSLVLARSIEQRTLMLRALSELSAAEEARGDARGALMHLRAYQALRDSVFDRQTAQRVAGMELEAEAARQRELNTQLRAADQAQRLVISRQRIIVALALALLVLAATLVYALWHFSRRERRRAGELARTNDELRTALAEVKTLSGFIPICANCKRIRDDDGYWQAVETYISSHSDAMFSHAICTQCGPELYGTDWEASAPRPPQGKVPSSPSPDRQ